MRLHILVVVVDKDTGSACNSDVRSPSNSLDARNSRRQNGRHRH